ncbi:MAG: PAS domain-containing protein [Sedimentisphaerales bacterium]|nr:PAS domain-containing protein [Sedimentisphaerales bacterium]
MKRERNFYITVLCVGAWWLFVGPVVEGHNYGVDEGGPVVAVMQHGPVLLGCCILMAMAAIPLGWHWLKLARAIASIARFIRNDEKAKNSVKESFFSPLRIHQINALCRTISEHYDQYAGRIGEYEKQIKELQLQLQLAHNRGRNIEAIIYSIRDAVIVTDEYDRLLIANEAAGRLFSFDFKESQRKPIEELISADRSEFSEFLSHSRKSKGQATRREIEFQEQDERKTYDCIVSCVYDRNQKVTGVVAVMHDITREKQIQQMKTDFVSHVSHELKTPLASITAYSEMLADGEANDERTRREFYSVIQNQANRLSRLIEDILNTSRIESGLIKVQKEPMSLTLLIEEQMQMIKGFAEEKNIEVSGQKPIVFDQVYVDKDMMSQVIVNLLSNAVKYTPAGGSVRVETMVDESASLARVTVTDTGVGIPADEIEHVFDKFYRVGANNKQAKGTGLGLNLVKQIVEKIHDGKVFVTSQVGVGSTFGFELPLATRRSVGVV